MKILLKKIPFVFLLLFGLFLVESCQEQDTVQPAPADHTDASVVQRITELGFDADVIKDMGTHYLVDGDIYFSKNNADEEKPGSEPARIDDGKYPVFTIRIDNEIAGNDTWKTAVVDAIAAWNADKRQHMHFTLTTSTDAHITVRADNGELTEEVPLASEFSEHGRLGSTVRVNMKYTGSITAEETKEKMLQALFRTTGCHESKITASSTASPKSSRVAVSSQIDIGDYLFIIRNDQLVTVNKNIFVDDDNYDPYVLSEGWQGSTHMVMGRDNYLYVIQYGVLWWADPRDGSWGYLSDGWADAQAMAASDHSYTLFIIDKNRDLYRYRADALTGTNDGKTLLADVGYIGSPRMAALYNGIAISDNTSLNRLYFYSNSGQLKTVATSKVADWRTVTAMYRIGSDEIRIIMTGDPYRLVQCNPQLTGNETTSTNKIQDVKIEGNEGAWNGIVAGVYNYTHKIDYFLKNGKLYWHGNSEPYTGFHSVDATAYWKGAFLITCDN